MKKSISKILCAALAAALVIPSFAADSQMQEETKVLEEVSVADSQVLDEVEISEEPIVPLSDEPHVYTALPGTEEWVEMTPRERRASCAVSKEEVEGMTTRALVETVVNYPYLINMYAYDKFDMGVQAVAESFPGLKELLSREDAGTALAEYENERVRLRSTDSVDRVGSQIRDASALRAYLEKLSEQKGDSRATRTIRTPKGTRITVRYNMSWAEWSVYAGVGHTVNMDEMYDEVEDFCAAYPEAEYLSSSSPSPKYNCHSYAWYSTDTSNKYWMEDPSAYMTDGSYVRATPDEGCRVAYRETNGTYRHSGIVTSVSGGVTTVESKWGALGVFSHAIDDCPYVGQDGAGFDDPEDGVGNVSVIVSCWELA